MKYTFDSRSTAPKYTVSDEASTLIETNSVNKALDALRQAINPPKTIKQPKRETVKYLTQAQTLGFFRAINKHHRGMINKSLFDPVMWRAMFMLSYRFGLRRSELCGLNVGDIKSDRSIYIRRAKGSESKTYPLTQDIWKHLHAWMESYANKTERDPLFINTRKQRYTGTGVYGMFKTLAVDAGISGFSPHALRHSIAVHMLQDGCRMVEVKDLLGHRSIMSTQIYAEVIDSMREIYMKKLRKSPFVVKV